MLGKTGQESAVAAGPPEAHTGRVGGEQRRQAAARAGGSSAGRRQEMRAGSGGEERGEGGGGREGGGGGEGGGEEGRRGWGDPTALSSQVRGLGAHPVRASVMPNVNSHRRGTLASVQGLMSRAKRQVTRTIPGRREARGQTPVGRCSGYVVSTATDNSRCIRPKACVGGVRVKANRHCQCGAPQSPKPRQHNTRVAIPTLWPTNRTSGQILPSPLPCPDIPQA